MSTATATRTDELVRIATQVRRDILRMVHGAKGGHPGGAVGCADYLTALYFEVMDVKVPFQMEGKGEDMFVLSNGHICAVQYSCLARKGYFPVSELATHRKINSRLQGHPATEEGLPGIRVASGSLGQGLSVATGMALGKKLDGDKHTVFCLMGDGEQQEGQVWEAVMYAAANKVDNLIAAIDWNNAQIDGSVEEVQNLFDLKAKYEAFGWATVSLDKGNDMEAVLAALAEAKAKSGKGQPIMILMKTAMGYPIDFMMGTHKWHGVAPSDEQLEAALGQLEETLGDY